VKHGEKVGMLCKIVRFGPVLPGVTAQKFVEMAQKLAGMF
jgi:hypothetical protein